MKLIVEVPKDEYEECKMQVEMIKREGVLVESLSLASKIHIANGIPTVDAIPMSVIDEIKAEIIDEAEFAYADFDRYKEEVLCVESDELPDDDFRYGLERAFEIINRKVKEYTDDM